MQLKWQYEHFTLQTHWAITVMAAFKPIICSLEQPFAKLQLFCVPQYLLGMNCSIKFYQGSSCWAQVIAYHAHRWGTLEQAKAWSLSQQAITRFSESQHRRQAGDKQVYIQQTQEHVCALLPCACVSFMFPLAQAFLQPSILLNLLTARLQTWCDARHFRYHNPLLWPVLNPGCIYASTSGRSFFNMPPRKANLSQESLRKNLRWPYRAVKCHNDHITWNCTGLEKCWSIGWMWGKKTWCYLFPE